MYAVPFFIWESESWKQAHRQDYGAFLDRHYQTSHFIHTWADLIGMRFEVSTRRRAWSTRLSRNARCWWATPVRRRASSTCGRCWQKNA